MFPLVQVRESCQQVLLRDATAAGCTRRACGGAKSEGRRCAAVIQGKIATLAHSKHREVFGPSSPQNGIPPARCTPHAHRATAPSQKATFCVVPDTCCCFRFECVQGHVYTRSFSSHSIAYIFVVLALCTNAEWRRLWKFQVAE
mmetsp:Transcript_71738/g.119964  ORF Transcript_71738/g.119964 Transcript_71738/m.119964 type:complete len:144 (-) Transcript_71738:270-701(-)